MVPEVEVIRHSDQIVLILRVPFVEAAQDLDFNKCLTMEPLLVPDNLDRDILARLMIVTLGNLSERSFAKHIQNFVTEHDMVVIDDDIISTLVVES